MGKDKLVVAEDLEISPVESTHIGISLMKLRKAKLNWSVIVLVVKYCSCV